MEIIKNETANATTNATGANAKKTPAPTATVIAAKTTPAAANTTNANVTATNSTSSNATATNATTASTNTTVAAAPAVPVDPRLLNATNLFNDAEKQLNKTKAMVLAEIMNGDKLLRKTYDQSITSIQLAIKILNSQLKPGTPKQLQFGNGGSMQVTTLELVFIIIFVLLAVSGASVCYLRKYKRRNQPTPEQGAKDSLEIDVKRAKKLIVGMSGTLDTINFDIEKSQTRLKAIKGDMASDYGSTHGSRMKSSSKLERHRSNASVIHSHVNINETMPHNESVFEQPRQDISALDGGHSFDNLLTQSISKPEAQTIPPKKISSKPTEQPSAKTSQPVSRKQSPKISKTLYIEKNESLTKGKEQNLMAAPAAVDEKPYAQPEDDIEDEINKVQREIDNAKEKLVGSSLMDSKNKSEAQNEGGRASIDDYGIDQNFEKTLDSIDPKVKVDDQNPIEVANATAESGFKLENFAQ